MERLVTTCSPNPEGSKSGALGLSLDSTPTHSMALGQGHCLDPSPPLLRMCAQLQPPHCRGQQELSQKVDWNSLACYKTKVSFVLHILHDHAIALPKTRFKKRTWVDRTHTTVESASHCTQQGEGLLTETTVRVPWKARMGKDTNLY